MDTQRILLFLLFAPGFLFSLSFHEAAHAWMANKLGDNTAKSLGRMTLNPLPHIDPIGTIVLPVLGFLSGWAVLAWAKPVPFDPRNLKNVRRDSMYIAAAGPLSNLILTFVFAGIIHGYGFFAYAVQGVLSAYVIDLIYIALNMIFVLNIVLMIFNFLPFDPLDGGKIIRGLLPHRAAVRFDQFMQKNQRMIMVVMLLLIFSGLFGKFFFPIIRGLAYLILGSKFPF